MRTDFQQFFVDPDHVQGDVFYLDGDEYRHAVKVLRKQEGDAISAVDGRGRLYHGAVREVHKDRIIVHIVETIRDIGEAKLNLIVAQAALKGAHFDLVVEKGTEIGVAAFQPMITDHVIVKADARTDRWRKKALTAMKQCGRSRCPRIYEPMDFESVVQQRRCDVAFIAHEDVDLESVAIRLPDKSSSAIVFIGPEGGFTNSEYQFALKKGVTPLNLGPRRLRAETAALVAATKILAATGALGNQLK